MSRLIHLNGAPASGKSTLAARYAEDHPLTLNLDIDQVRRMLGRWRADPGEAGLRARAIALAAAEVHLRAGHEVIVPQMVARVEFIERLAAVATAAGAGFCEVFLHDSLDSLVRRFADRTRTAADPTHIDAAATLAGGEAELKEWHDRITALGAERPHAVTIESVPGAIDQTYAALESRLRRSEPGEGG